MSKSDKKRQILCDTTTSHVQQRAFWEHSGNGRHASLGVLNHSFLGKKDSVVSKSFYINWHLMLFYVFNLFIVNLQNHYCKSVSFLFAKDSQE